MTERERRGFVSPGLSGRAQPQASAKSPRVYSREFLTAFWGGGAEPAFPALDVSEDDARVVISAELPGVKREDVTLELLAGSLTIRGEKRSERTEAVGRSRVVERSFGAFARSIALPSDADPERVQAALADGVLTVTIEKRAARKPRSVEVREP